MNGVRFPVGDQIGGSPYKLEDEPYLRYMECADIGHDVVRLLNNQPDLIDDRPPVIVSTTEAFATRALITVTPFIRRPRRVQDYPEDKRIELQRGNSNWPLLTAQIRTGGVYFSSRFSVLSERDLTLTFRWPRDDTSVQPGEGWTISEYQRQSDGTIERRVSSPDIREEDTAYARRVLNLFTGEHVVRNALTYTAIFGRSFHLPPRNPRP